MAHRHHAGEAHEDVAHATPGPTRAGHERRTWAVAALFAAAVAVQLAAAGAAHSTALVAEALHMGAHVSAFALAGLAYAAARRLEAAGRTRAAAVAPDLAALLNGVLLLALGADLAASSAGALGRPHAVDFGLALGAAGAGLVVNLVAAGLLHHDHAHEHGHGRDVNFTAVRLHVLGDAAAALMAIVGLGAGRLFGWSWTDGAAGVVGAGLVVALGLQVCLQSARYLRRDRANLSRST